MTALIAYRYTNDRIYVQAMRRNSPDKEVVPTARIDWRADGVVDYEEWDYAYEQWIDDMELANLHIYGAKEPTREQVVAAGRSLEDNSVYPPPGTNPFYLVETMWECGTDKFVGFSKTWMNQTHAEHEVTCIVPEMRGNGYHTDFNILSPKSWFHYNSGETITLYSPKDLTPSDKLYWAKHVIGKETYKERDDRVDRVAYVKVDLTKQDYIDFMDLPENHVYRDETFRMQRWLDP